MSRAKLYIDITNACNIYCPFCCANSSPLNTRFMSFELFKSIIEKDNHDELEIQIEGGEPAINSEIWHILNYCNDNNRIKKIIILHNCTKIDEYIKYFKSYSFSKKVELKLSLNFYLLKLFPDLISKIENTDRELKTSDYVKVYVNVRYREDNADDNNMIKSIFMTSIPASRICVYEFCNFGRASEFETPCTEWLGYASDGKFFGTDTDKRFEYEKKLQ